MFRSFLYKQDNLYTEAASAAEAHLVENELPL